MEFTQSISCDPGSGCLVQGVGSQNFTHNYNLRVENGAQIELIYDESLIQFDSTTSLKTFGVA